MVSAAATAATDGPIETTLSAASRFVRPWKDHLFRTERQAIAGPVEGGARSVKVLNTRGARYLEATRSAWIVPR